MTDGKSNLSHRIWLGGILITLGFLFLLDSLNLMDFGDFISTWWPLILIIFGLNRLANKSALALGSVVLFLGIIFQLMELNLLPDNAFKYLWPLALIFFGLWLVAKAAGRGSAGGKEEGADEIKVCALWGGIEKNVTSSQFRGGEVTALMGGIELNLRQAQLSQAPNELKITTIMGGVSIMVPENWNVVVTGTPLLGGIEDKTRKGAETSVSGGTLKLNCFALMGGIEIKN